MKEEENAALIKHLQAIWSISLSVVTHYYCYLSIPYISVSLSTTTPYSNYNHHHVFPSPSCQFDRLG